MRAIFCRDSLLSDAYQVSTHYIARCFARSGWDALWLNRPWHPYGFINPRWMKERNQKLRIWFRGEPAHDSPGLKTYAFGTMAPYRHMPFLRSAWLGRHTLRFAIPPVRRKLREMGYENPDLLWISDVAQFSILDLVPARCTVLHITDDYLSFASTPPSFLALESWAVKRADAVVVPSPKLAALLCRRHGIDKGKIIVLPHGVALDPERLASPPPDFSAIPRPRVVYLGALEAWLNWDLIEECAARLTRVSFVFIGSARLPDRDTALRIAALARRENVHFLGERARPDAMACLAEADAAIIPFQAPSDAPSPERTSESSHEPESPGFRSSVRLAKYALPMKLFEFLALGLPVVSTRNFWSDLSLDIRTPLFVASDPTGFCDSLSAALEGKPSGREGWRQAGVEFARANTWENRYKDLLDRLALSEPVLPQLGASRGGQG